MEDRLVVILGPTAGGKSALAVAIGRAVGGEIVNADSMQVYRHMDAGTAKPTAEERAAVPHHLVDIVEPTERWTVADWIDAAEACIADIQGRGKLPIVVGGTNLYLKALLEGFFEGPPADEPLRASLENVDSSTLHERLSGIDPEAADRIHPNDRKRIVRALEVHHQTGRPISQMQQQWADADRESAGGQQPYHHNPILLGLHWPADLINRRINARVKAMFDPAACGLAEREDLVSETQRLEAAGRLGPQAREALGTKQTLAYLHGETTLEEAFEQTKIETRRFAKAQRTWLKRYRGVHWLDAVELSAEAAADRAIEIVRGELSGPGRGQSGVNG